MSKKVFLLAAVFSAGTAFAQSLAPDVIASSGSTFTDGTSQLDWTLGEPATLTLTDGTTLLTQGFHQPNLLITAVGDAADDVSVSVFPNPVVDHVHLLFEKEQEFLTLDVISVEGKVLHSQNTANAKNIDVDMSAYTAGTYLFSIRDKNSRTRTYQIIKLK